MIPMIRAVVVSVLLSAAAWSVLGCTTAPLATTSKAADEAGASGELRLFFTSDEHGWLAPVVDKKEAVQRGGVHSFAWKLKDQGFMKGKPGQLLLSSGDMWTGPYESTVLEGRPMAAAMSQLGYSAAAVGNHEFDFGLETLIAREKSSAFPFLGANLLDESSGQLPAWALPYVIVDTGGLRVGIVGLACKESPTTADPRNMRGIQFGEYAAALEKWLPRVAMEGVDEIVVLVHDSVRRVKPLLPILRRHRVHAVATGHQHVTEVFVDAGGTPDPDDDVMICNPGPYLRSFCRMDLAFVRGRLVAGSVRHHDVEVAADADIAPFDEPLAKIVDEAEASANRIGGEVLVQNLNKLERGPQGALGQLVVDSWLEALPFAQVAITNVGGLRQDLEPGPLRLRDVVSTMPFNNYLLVVDMTGAQLKQALANPQSIAAGVRYTARDEGFRRAISDLVDTSGKPISDNARLKVVINDFMYRGGDHYTFAEWDQEPEETAVDWREPVFRLLRSLGQKNEPLQRTPDDRAGR